VSHNRRFATAVFCDTTDRSSKGATSAKGPITIFEVLRYDFRITLENGLNSDIAACPKRATTGLMRRSKWTLLSSALHFAPVAFLSAIIARILVPWYFRLRRTV
jgi:hypothetical protein